MSGLHGPIARICVVIALTLGVMSSGVAQPGIPLRGRQAADVEATATLRMLSVRPLRVDRPWDPKICIGCEVQPVPHRGRASAAHPR